MHTRGGRKSGGKGVIARVHRCEAIVWSAAMAPWLIDAAGGGRCAEARGLECQRHEDVFPQKILVTLTRSALDDRAEQAVTGIAVGKFSRRLHRRVG